MRMLGFKSSDLKRVNIAKRESVPRYDLRSKKWI